MLVQCERGCVLAPFVQQSPLGMKTCAFYLFRLSDAPFCSGCESCTNSRKCNACLPGRAARNSDAAEEGPGQGTEGAEAALCPGSPQHGDPRRILEVATASIRVCITLCLCFELSNCYSAVVRATADYTSIRVAPSDSWEVFGDEWTIHKFYTCVFISFFELTSFHSGQQESHLALSA
jgi:hypothetical protein